MVAPAVATARRPGPPGCPAHGCAARPGNRAIARSRGPSVLFSSMIVAGGVGVLGPERPLLEPGAAPVVAQVDDPQIAVLLARRIAVEHLGPHHRGRAVDGQDAGGQREELV